MPDYPTAAALTKHALACRPSIASLIRGGGDKGGIGSSALLETFDVFLPVLDGSTSAPPAPSNPEKLATVYTYPDAPKEPICRELLLTSFVPQDLFCRIVGENGGGVMRKCVIAVKRPADIVPRCEKRLLDSLSFRDLMQFLRANDLVAVLGCDGVGRIAFATPSARRCNDGASLPSELDFVGSLHYAFQKDFVQLAMKAREAVLATRPSPPLSVQPQLPRAEDGEVEEGELVVDTHLPLLRQIDAVEALKLQECLTTKLQPAKRQSDNEMKLEGDITPITPIITMVQECCSLGEIRGKLCALLKNTSQALQALECIEVCLVDFSPPIVPSRAGTDAADGAALVGFSPNDDELLDAADGAALSSANARGASGSVSLRRASRNAEILLPDVDAVASNVFVGSICGDCSDKENVPPSPRAGDSAVTPKPVTSILRTGTAWKKRKLEALKAVPARKVPTLLEEVWLLAM